MRPAILLIVSAFIFYLTLAWLSIDRLVVLSVGDDMFYYLKIAEHLANGRGVTFDGETPTNGFHPVYLFVLTPLFRLFPHADPAFFVHIALSLLSLATVGTGFWIYAILKNVTHHTAALFALTAWLFNPFVIGITLSGVEAAIATFMLATSTWAALKLRSRWVDHTPKGHEFALMGGIFGIACLCRTDSVFFVLTLGSALWIFAAKRLERKHLWPYTFTLGGTFLLVLSPWLIWNLFRFGTIVQDSAAVLSYRSHSLFFADHERAELMPYLIEQVLKWATILGRCLGLGGTGLPLFILGIVSGSLIGKHNFAQNESRDRVSHLRFLLFLVIPPVLTIGFYALYFWHRQYWYFLGPLFCIATLSGLAYHHIENLFLTRSKRIAHFLLPLVVFTILPALYLKTGIGIYRRGFNPWQSVYIDAAHELDRLIPKDARIGAFNAGIFSFFSRRNIVNLDGVVNREILSAMKEKKLLSYLYEKRITHLLDHRGVIESYALWAEPDFLHRFRLVKEFPTPPSNGNVVLLSLHPKETDVNAQE